MEPMLPEEEMGIEAVTLEGREAKKGRSRREDQACVREGHLEGSQNRWVGHKGLRQDHSFCLLRETIPCWVTHPGQQATAHWPVSPMLLSGPAHGSAYPGGCYLCAGCLQNCLA